MNKKKILWISLATVLAVVLIVVICVVSLKSCDKKDDPADTSHTHTFAEEWTQGETQHWHASTCGHDVKKDEADHTYVDGKCSVCGYLKPSDGITYTLSADGKYYTVTGTTSQLPNEVVIAGVYDGKPVTIIGESAFDYKTSITSVVIPDSVTSIETYAFDNCHSLASVTIGKGVTSIGKMAFKACSSLTSVTIPDSVTSINAEAFYTCGNLKWVVIGSGVTSIGEKAFYSCNNLVKVFYAGTTVEQWNNIAIGDSNANLTGANRFYYSESDPTTVATTMYWHYNNGVPTPWYE